MLIDILCGVNVENVSDVDLISRYLIPIQICLKAR